ncbi:ABC transporter permease [Acuticoccus kandeliae]|uniref:ABC transporter permease n=1 Tax=Acuticoccus kandeliae TaxID=2073160 RepID=UPI000D3E0508|nr:ABC transporter permease [Acuticoccus kandeliae]
MLRLVVNRIASAIVLIVIASVFSFILIAAFPGNIAALIAELRGGFVSQEVVDQVAREYRLDQPMIVRYGYWVGDVLQGDLGHSLRTGEPVAEALAERGVATLTLVAGGSLVALIVAFSLAFCGAAWPGGAVDRLLRAFALVSISTPKFFLAALLIYAFGVTLNLLPTFGFRGPASWILPSIAMGLLPGAVLSRVARVSLEDAMSRPYVITALSKGMSRRRILLVDALPNIVPVVVTAFGMEFAFMAQSAILIEPIFAWQGFGNYFVEAARFRDIPVLQSCLMIFSVLFIVVNLIVDLSVMAINPMQRRTRTA